MHTVFIRTYRPDDQPAFQQLNEAWIQHYFTLEPHDREQLEHPDVHVLPDGGQIFLAVVNGATIGCVAIINLGDAGYELAKMAVTPAAQGQGVGRLLCQAAIDYARQQGIAQLWLESNRRLAPALNLYRSLGFVEVPSIPTPYSRADIRMELLL